MGCALAGAGNGVVTMLCLMLIRRARVFRGVVKSLASQPRKPIVTAASSTTFVVRVVFMRLELCDVRPPPNVADHRRRAGGVQNEIEASSRRSVQPLFGLLLILLASGLANARLKCASNGRQSPWLGVNSRIAASRASIVVLFCRTMTLSDAPPVTPECNEDDPACIHTSAFGRMKRRAVLMKFKILSRFSKSSRTYSLGRE